MFVCDGRAVDYCSMPTVTQKATSREACAEKCQLPMLQLVPRHQVYPVTSPWCQVPLSPASLVTVEMSFLRGGKMMKFRVLGLASVGTKQMVSHAGYRSLYRCIIFFHG